ncbi:hypothetical protein AtubIFM55763_001432 [Aspergillus tubingensis]|nr:hypothetical protein AtubIFM55763_001432 [Aspergillus tubingensis]
MSHVFSVDIYSKEQIQAIERLLPQQTSLIGKLMTWPTSLSVEDEWRRRNEATEAVRLDCDVLEGGPRRGQRPKRTIPVERTIRIDDSPAKAVVVQAPVPSLSTSPSPHEATLRAAAEDIRIADTPRTCFQCYGDQAESDNRRVKQYAHHKGLIRHFRNEHSIDRHCNYCNEPVSHDMHWRRHVEGKHRLSIRYRGEHPGGPL